VLTAATELGVLDPAIHQLAVDALVNHWSDDDPRWMLLDTGRLAGQGNTDTSGALPVS
jgi:hypothetical protein